MQEWDTFSGKRWQQVIDVDDFIINNYKEYLGSSDFLKGTSRKTGRIWSRCQKILEKEDITNVLDIETNYFSGIDNFDPGYIDKKSEVIVGLQTDDPLKQFVNPFIALDTSVDALKNYGYRINRELIDRFKEFGKSHENVTNDTYTKEINKYREVHLLEGLPDNYGRGFIVSDYRRLPLYGADYLISKKRHDLDRLKRDINYSMVRTREEVVKQIEALEDIKNMANRYGYDISRPASNAKEAVQWLYFAYLSATKETSGASMPIGNNTAFLDIYINRDLENGIINEEEAQELIDQFIIKLRMIRFLHVPEYHNYFAGKNPIITETIGGMYNNKSLITKTAYRILNSIENLDVYPVPNFSILWSTNLPTNFKRYCAKVMLKNNILQFINGDLLDNNDYTSTGLAGLSKVGKQIDYYGGSCNLPKALLYAINGGKDEITGEQIIDGIEPLLEPILDYSKVVRNFSFVLKKLISIQSDALNIIHYVHDKYAYESSLMAFNDTVVERYISFGITGLSTVVDSLSAIHYSKVKVNRNENGISTDFIVENKFPRFGNNSDEADRLALDIVKLFNKLVLEHHFYRNAKPKIGIESMGLNIVYGNNTGATPDGRFKGVAYAPGVNPISNVDCNGVLASLKSIMKIPSILCKNGIITTLNVNHNALGSKKSERAENIIGLLDGYFSQNGSHLEMNIIDRNILLEAANNEKQYDYLVIRNSGCAFRFIDLTETQQDDLADRTFHKVL